MATIADVIERWERLLHGRCVSGSGRPLGQLSGSRVFGHGDTLYSYGRHFPLCEYLRPNRRRRRALYLLNGDRFSVSTTRHQNETRAVVERAARERGADTIIVPFSALNAARIDRSSIVPLEIRPDEWSVVERCEPFERVPQWRRPNPDGTARHPDTAIRGDDGLYRWQDRVHRLGDSLFVADVPGTRTVRRVASVRQIVDSARWGSLATDVADDGTIAEAVRVNRRHRFVSSFDVNEPAPLYFLAQLPATSRARTVASAIQDLAPPAVHAAIARGRHVDRQGDIFAIETTLADSDMQGWPRARLTSWTRGAAPRKGEHGYVAALTATERRALAARARALWSQRWDALAPPAGPVTPRNLRRENRRIVAARVGGLERARDAARRAILSRKATTYTRVRGREAAEHMRRDLFESTLRRGHARDEYRRLSAITPGTRALSLWRDCQRDALHELRPELTPSRQDRYRSELRALLSVHGTAHSATEVARGPGGAVYIRGAMRHVPELEVGRGGVRDHVNRPLREGVWYLAVRNTVPRQRTDRRAR